MTARAAVFFSLFLAACGGKVEEEAVATSTDRADGCARACVRMSSTCGAFDASGGDCERSCRAELDDPASAGRYADCIDALSCADIQRGVSMDYGPIGACWSQARRGR